MIPNLLQLFAFRIVVDKHCTIMFSSVTNQTWKEMANLLAIFCSNKVEDFDIRKKTQKFLILSYLDNWYLLRAKFTNDWNIFIRSVRRGAGRNLIETGRERAERDGK